MSSDTPGSRSVSIGGDATGNVIVTGDHNTVSYQQANLPPASDVDIRAELAALRRVLEGLDLPSKEQRKVRNALAEADEEAAEPKPDRAEVGAALKRAVDAVEKAGKLARATEALKEPLIRAVAWLGENWHSLLGSVGLRV